MIYLLRDLKTGRFFINSEEWTASQEKARQFGSIDEAIATATGLKSRDLEVFFGNGGIRLPVDNEELRGNEMAQAPRADQRG
jgi:hypothetical protein